MATKKKIEEPKTVKIETTDSVKAIIADCLTRKNLAQLEIRKLNETVTTMEEKLNSVLISYMEGKGYMLVDYNIIEYCDHARYLIIEKTEKK